MQNANMRTSENLLVEAVPRDANGNPSALDGESVWTMDPPGQAILNMGKETQFNPNKYIFMPKGGIGAALVTVAGVSGGQPLSEVFSIAVAAGLVVGFNFLFTVTPR